MHAKALVCAVLLGGCAGARSAPPKAVTLTSANAPAPRTERTAEAAAPSASPVQRPGDYVVYRFSGTFRKAPLTLTQRVLDVRGAVTRLELTFDDARSKRVVRARYDRTPGAAHEIAEAMRVGADGAELPLTLGQLDAMMAETALAVDANEDALGTDEVTLDVGRTPLKCKRTRFRVLVGKRKAVMTSLTSDAFPWGDVGGEIATEDGKVLYRAEVVDVGSRT
jgi:hypothetical protein